MLTGRGIVGVREDMTWNELDRFLQDGAGYCVWAYGCIAAYETLVRELGEGLNECGSLVISTSPAFIRPHECSYDFLDLNHHC